LFKKFIILFFFFNFLLSLHADEKQFIIDRLVTVANITFDFEQTTNEKKEIGRCILVFDNKLKCNYKDSMQKEVLINEKRLVISQKRYNKIHFYPISNSLFMTILNKKNLLSLIRKSNYKLKDNIELVYINKSKNKITIYFDAKNYELIGWKVNDQLQNEINFSLKIKSINSDFNPETFKIPKRIREQN
jgi:outer membrane lipoprotein-sorting protein